MRQKRRDDDPREVVDALRKRASADWGPEFLDRHGANAVSIGWKVQGQRPTRKISLRLHVEPGYKHRRRKGVDFIRKHLEYATDSGRALQIETDVEESRRPRLTRLNPLATHRRIPGGVSIGAAMTVGTLGGWAWDRGVDAPVLVSAAHIFSGAEGAPIMQPARSDRLKRPDRIVGTIRRFTTFDPDTINLIDAATATIENLSLPLFRVLKVGPAIMAMQPPMLGLPVEKFGRTSRLTKGNIVDEFWRGWVASPTGEWALYSDCMRIIEDDQGTWAAPGDSGSIVFGREPLDDDSGVKPAIGLHFAADEVDQRLGIACRIDNVFAEFDLSPLPAALLRVAAQGAGGDERGLTALLGELQHLLRTGPGGVEVLELFNRHRVALVETLLRSNEARKALLAAARTIFDGSPDAEALLDQDVSRRARNAVTRFLEILRDESRGPVGRACTALLRRLRNGEGSWRAILELGGEEDNILEPVIQPSSPARLAALYREYVEQFGDELMRRYGAIAISAGRPMGADTEPAVAVKFFALPERLAVLRRRVPRELVWERPGQAPVKLVTAVEASRPVKKH